MQRVNDSGETICTLDNGSSINIGNQENGQKNRSVVTQAAPSTVGSIQGDLRLIAGNDYVQTGSNVLALNGNIDILGRNVTIQEARVMRMQKSLLTVEDEGGQLSLSG